MSHKAENLRLLAAKIEQLFPELVAIVYPAAHPLGGFCNTDRKIGRLRHPGKGRRGSRLMVSIRPGHEQTPFWRDRRGPVVFEHNAAETYRTNADVVRWIEDETRRRKAAEKK